jgi:hypothetical protein
MGQKKNEKKSPEPGGTQSEKENSLLTPFGLLATRALNLALGIVTESM